MSLIATQDLTVRSQDRTILRTVSLALEAGETVAVLGPNGSGKSTLARSLVGLVAPSSGTVHRAAGIRLGYVPQFIHQDETLPVSCRTFLAQGRPRMPGRDRAGLLDGLGVSPLLNRPISALSGGELRRVGIARALMRLPDALILDEPTAGVDAASQSRILALLADYPTSAGNRGTIVISHEIFVVLPLVDRAILLDGGIVAQGTPLAIVRHPEFARLFGAHAAAAAQALLGGAPAEALAGSGADG